MPIVEVRHLTLAARDDRGLVDLSIVREDTLSIDHAGLFLRPSSFFCSLCAQRWQYTE